MTINYDLIIVGAGPAGLTAGLYASRRALKTLILSKDLGGQASLSFDIENYPGVKLIDGLSLMQKFANQALNFQCEIKYGEVIKIEDKKKYFQVFTKETSFTTRSIILSCGLHPKNLGVPGEEKFKGRGVSYCATCDGPLFKNKTVAVAGGGNSALDAADFLSKIASKVYLIHRRDQFRGEEVVVEKLRQAKNVEFVLSAEITEIKGDQSVKSISVVNNGKNKITELPIDGIFIEIGYSAKTDFLKKLVELNKNGEIIINKDCETSRKGVFACGDVTDATYKQIIISAGEGAKAALQAYKYLCINAGFNILPDWNRKKQKNQLES